MFRERRLYHGVVFEVVRVHLIGVTQDVEEGGDEDEIGERIGVRRRLVVLELLFEFLFESAVLLRLEEQIAEQHEGVLDGQFLLPFRRRSHIEEQLRKAVGEFAVRAALVQKPEDGVRDYVRDIRYPVHRNMRVGEQPRHRPEFGSRYIQPPEGVFESGYRTHELRARFGGESRAEFAELVGERGEIDLGVLHGNVAELSARKRVRDDLDAAESVAAPESVDALVHDGGERPYALFRLEHALAEPRRAVVCGKYLRDVFPRSFDGGSLLPARRAVSRAKAIRDVLEYALPALSREIGEQYEHRLFGVRRCESDGGERGHDSLKPHLSAQQLARFVRRSVVRERPELGSGHGGGGEQFARAGQPLGGDDIAHGIGEFRRFGVGQSRAPALTRGGYRAAREIGGGGSSLFGVGGTRGLLFLDAGAKHRRREHEGHDEREHRQKDLFRVFPRFCHGHTLLLMS